MTAAVKWNKSRKTAPKTAVTSSAVKSAQIIPAVKWSLQQADFLEWCKTGVGSCILVAVAGAGKTTVLLEGSRHLVGKTAIMAFNKRVAEEIKEKLIKLGIDPRKVEAGTVHSFGFRALRKTFPKIKVVGGKLSILFRDMFEDESTEAKFKDLIVSLVSLAKQRAVGALLDADDTQVWEDIINHFDLIDERNPAPKSLAIQAARKLLAKSNATADMVDFDDMVYLPLLTDIGFGSIIFDNIIVDEAQDTNSARRALVHGLLRQGGRGIFVGDPKQAIYGFTGADNDSLDILKREFNAIELPLTVTYRCPKQVVTFANQWVDHIIAADSAPEGEVREIEVAELTTTYREQLDKHAAVLCRNTKPLVELFYTLLRARIPARVEGRDIAAGLKKLATNWLSIKTIRALEDKLGEYLEKETAKLKEKKQEYKIEALTDRVGALLTICDQVRRDGGTHIDQVVKALDEMFGDDVQGLVVLSTIHKSKGREWERVFWLNRAGLCPSKHATQAWEMDQEENLQYVAATRAKKTLFDVMVPQKDTE